MLEVPRCSPAQMGTRKKAFLNYGKIVNQNTHIWEKEFILVRIMIQKMVTKRLLINLMLGLMTRNTMWILWIWQRLYLEQLQMILIVESVI